MDVLKNKLIDEKTDVYFIVCAVDNPFIYVRMKGTIIKRVVDNNNDVLYYIKANDFIEPYDRILNDIDNHNFKGFHDKSMRKGIMKYNMMDFIKESPTKLDLMKHIESNFENNFIVSPFFVFEDKKKMKESFAKINKTITNRLLTSLNKIKKITEDERKFTQS